MARISLTSGLTVVDVSALTPAQVSWLHETQGGGLFDANIAAQVAATDQRAWLEEYADAHERSYADVFATQYDGENT